MLTFMANHVKGAGNIYFGLMKRPYMAGSGSSWVYGNSRSQAPQPKSLYGKKQDISLTMATIHLAFISPAITLANDIGHPEVKACPYLMS